MICNGLSVNNFRNIKAADVAFDRGVNVLHGDNAQGKTSLLEAIYFISLGRSFRSAHEADLIMFGEDYSRISLDYADSLRNQNIRVYLAKDKRKQVEQNRVKVTKMSDIIGQFRAVMFCPEHLSLVKDGPSERRAYLDVAISQLRPVYLKSLQKYNQILKQRNQLIKSAYFDRKAFDDTIEFWSAQLAHEAAVIASYRHRYLSLAEKAVEVCFSEMTNGRETPSLVYVGSSKQAEEEYADVARTEEVYLNLLTTRHDREIGAGCTLYGTHKDDVDILLNGVSARLFASQGQQRSLALAMKLAEGEVCHRICGELPVFLFDDVFSELDSTRRAYLSEKIEGKQVIITSCDPACVGNAHVISVENGRYCEA